MERVAGIEPASLAWEADVLPLNYTRKVIPIMNDFFGIVKRKTSVFLYHFLRNGCNYFEIIFMYLVTYGNRKPICLPEFLLILFRMEFSSLNRTNVS